MARSPFTLAAAVTAALPGAEVIGVRALSAGGEGRFDSVVASLAGGEEVVLRVAGDDAAAVELAAEALALRALTAGARAMLPFRAPAYLGETLLGDDRGLVTDLMPGYLIEAAHLPWGEGAARSAGKALAAVHALPAFVVRTAGLVARSAAESRAEVRSLIDRAAATGLVPARLIVRWRGAAEDEALWQFESCVTLGGAQATSFVYTDDASGIPAVRAITGWHGLSIDDPAIDLAWLSSAPQAAEDVHAAYAEAIGRGPDRAIMLRARLRAELEFARWLLHGQDLRDQEIMDDASALLDALAETIRESDLAVIAERSGGTASAVESALGAAGRVPRARAIDTSMQTDTYTADELWIAPAPADPQATEQVEEIEVAAAAPVTPADSLAPDAATGASATPADPLATEPFDPLLPAYDDFDDEPDPEAQRAARAALQRWRSSASE